MTRRLMTAQEAADWLALPSAKWLLSQARQDRVPHHRLGKYVRFSAEDIEHWLSTDVARGPRRKEASR